MICVLSVGYRHGRLNRFATAIVCLNHWRLFVEPFIEAGMLDGELKNYTSGGPPFGGRSRAAAQVYLQPFEST